MSFTKTKEDFTCEHCHVTVQGSGYTNHCPKCLWSKHVDVDPGDRTEECQGLMRPVRVEGTVQEYVLVHRCETCGMERRNKTSSQDSVDALVALAASPHTSGAI